MGKDVVIATAEFRAALRVDRLVVSCLLKRWLMRGGPELAAFDIAQVTECSPAVAGGVLVPAGHCQVPPAAVPAAGGSDSDVVAAVREQMNFRRRCSGRCKDAIVCFG